MPRVPLFEQLEELEDQFGRMHRSYPGLVARGLMRRSVAEFHIERMAAAVETLAWLTAHRDALMQYIDYARKTGLQDPVEDGEPPCVLVEDEDHAEAEMPEAAE